MAETKEQKRKSLMKKLAKVDDYVTKTIDIVPTAIAGAGAVAGLAAAGKGIRDFKRGMDKVRKTNYLGGRSPKIKRMDNM